MLDQRCRHQLPDVFRVVQGLEGDPDDFVIQKHRPAAVAGVDGGIHGDGEQRTLRVVVLLHLDATHDALGDGNLLPTHRVANNRNRISVVWKVAKFHWFDSRSEAGFVDRKQRLIRDRGKSLQSERSTCRDPRSTAPAETSRARRRGRR